MAEKILMIVTTADKVTDDIKTGIWLSEFAEPFIEFKKYGYDVTIASPKGGKAPLDPNSMEENQPKGFIEAIPFLDSTLRLEEVEPSEYKAVFLPGGHGTMFDLPDNKTLHTILKYFIDKGKLIGAVCHGPSGLVEAKGSDGRHFVNGKKLTAFTDAEEKETTLDGHMPFLLESKLRELGALFVEAPEFTDHVVVDRNLVTGQNPQSSLSTARAFLEELQK
ncbi:type 1 glutamine amidotransferase domain-containing protein [Metabacillus arenae]|uniref:Type 1 glutamine amidotransferase domain-containing protein n=1 Tax=Metabacillus arenae TaxID=2771434 RepID=A0A926RWE4_9BACI|nr:type 1 glutamine amidotransferase domain-containing protein [Metabacillus arenae]MBD1379831.1 type 1 glutamine amidotransferase domain-containing protein [Metabacillus arenae]